MGVHLFGTVDIDGLWLLRFTSFDERKDITIEGD